MNEVLRQRMRSGKVVLSVLFAFALIVVPSAVSAKLVVNTNVQSINAIKKLNETNKNLSKVFERISSGLGIQSAADDAGGLGMAESMDADYKAVVQAIRNVKDAVSVIQTAEGAANEVANILKRMRELAVQTASETLATDEREYIQDEFEQLKEEIDTIYFNGLESSDEESNGISIQSSTILKLKDRFFSRVEKAVDLIRDIDVEAMDDEDGEPSPEQQIDAISKSLTAALAELARATDVVARSTDKTIRAAERKIQKLEQQRKKQLKVKPKPRR